MKMIKKRIAYKKSEKENLIEKILMNQNIVIGLKKPQREIKRTSITLIRNECILTGRKRGVLRDFKLSRLAFKRLGSKRMIAGLRKSAW